MEFDKLSVFERECTPFIVFSKSKLCWDIHIHLYREIHEVRRHTPSRLRLIKAEYLGFNLQNMKGINPEGIVLRSRLEGI